VVVRRRWLLGALTFALVACSSGGPARATPDRLLDLRWARAGNAAGPAEWSGADGTSSVSLPDGRAVWFFSDTFLGPVNRDGSRRGARAVRNSMVVQDGRKLTTVAAGTPVNPPPGVPGWYWDAAGHVEGGRLVEFYHRITGTTGWDFTEQGVAQATFSLPGLKLEGVRELPVAPQLLRTPIMWGAALFDDGPWTYIYGYRARLDQTVHPKFLYVARTPRGHVADLAAWQYDTGTGWSWDAARVAEKPTQVDSAFGLVRVGDAYALVTRRPTGDLGDGALMAYLGPTPAGPFRTADSALLYHAPEVAAGWYVYGARVHPQLGGHGRIVVSYNVNSTMVDARCVPENVQVASLYRPRFVSVPVGVFRRGYTAPPAAGAKRSPGWYLQCPK
jgi:hypothetical protein